MYILTYDFQLHKVLIYIIPASQAGWIYFFTELIEAFTEAAQICGLNEALVYNLTSECFTFRLKFRDFQKIIFFGLFIFVG